MSVASYIIICNGRIDLAAAKNSTEMIQAASRAATDLVTYYGDKLGSQDAAPITDLQHKMMDVLSGAVREHPKADYRSPIEMVDEMFAHLDALEKKMSS